MKKIGISVKIHSNGTAGYLMINTLMKEGWEICSIEHIDQNDTSENTIIVLSREFLCE